MSRDELKQSLEETRQELRLLTDDATREATMREFGLDRGLLPGYLRTLEAQERALLRRLGADK